MSKVTPSALRGLSVAAGTVGLAAVGAAAVAGQAAAASSFTPGLGNGLPVSTNAVPAVLGAVAHNPGTIAGIPLSSLPGLSQLQEGLSEASPTSDALPGLGYASLGALPVTRSRPVTGDDSANGAYVPKHAAPVSAESAPDAPEPSVPPAAGTRPQVPGPTPAQAAAAAKAAQSGPLDNVTNALHGLPIAGSLTGNLPLGGLGGLTNGLSGLGG